jgi:ABC-type dipeptide/oligopeptide/nickel transport system permease component
MIKALADIHFPHLPISLIYIIVGLVICHASALLFWVYSALKKDSPGDAFSQFIKGQTLSAKRHQK